MVTKVWIIVNAEKDYNGSSILECEHFYFSPFAAELAISDACMQGLWKVRELTLAERA
jgi:hypothetical protein